MACNGREFTSAVIVAGGKGERLGGNIRKQYLKLGGRSILGRTLSIFAGLVEIDELIVVAPEADIGFIEGELIPSELGALISSKQIKITEGGANRQESAMAGLAAINDRCGIVLIHDAVRPFTQSSHILRVIEKAREYGGSIIAVPVKDTIKRCDEGFITQTVLRDGLWSAQTPQAFDAAKLRRAHNLAAHRGITVTDDAALFEELGYEVAVVEGSATNIKITTEEDLDLAKAILEIIT